MRRAFYGVLLGACLGAVAATSAQIGTWVSSAGGLKLLTQTAVGTPGLATDQRGTGAAFEVFSAGSSIFRLNADGTCEGTGCAAPGSGSGDASTNTSSSIDSELALFSSTSGKILKRANLTGLILGTSGVASAYGGAPCADGEFISDLSASGVPTCATPAGGGGGMDTTAIDTSAELDAIVTDDTGSGALVFATSPTLVTPALGTPTTLVLTNATGLVAGAFSAATNIPLTSFADQADETILCNISNAVDVPTACTWNALLDAVVSPLQGVMLVNNAAGWGFLGPCTAGQFPQFGGSGADMACADGTGTTNAAGSDTMCQFNDGGTAFGGDAGCTFNKTLNTLTITGTITGAGWRNSNAAKTANFTFSATDGVIFCDATSGAVTGTLPASSGLDGREYKMIKVDASSNACVFDGNSSETLNGTATYSLTQQYAGATAHSDNTNWFVTDDVVPGITDPGADAIFGFDDSDNATEAMLIGAGLVYNGTTLSFDPSTTLTYTNATINAESTGNVITLPGWTMFPLGVCQGATATYGLSHKASLAPTGACLGTEVKTFIATFPDSDGEFEGQANLPLAPDFTGVFDIRGKWRTAATSGDIVLQVQWVCVGDAEVTSDTWSAASTTTETAKGTTLQWNDWAITGVTLSGCAAGEDLAIRVFRDRGHASDSLTGTFDMKPFGVMLRRAM